MDAAREVAQLGERELGVLARLPDEVERVLALGEPVLGEPDRQGDGHEPLLRAVVQVALEPPALRVGRGDDPRLRGGEPLDARGQHRVRARAEHEARERGVDARERLERLHRERRREDAHEQRHERLRQRVDLHEPVLDALGDRPVVEGRRDQPERDPEQRHRDHEVHDPERERDHEVDEVLPRRGVRGAAELPAPPGAFGRRGPVRILEVGSEQRVGEPPLPAREHPPQHGGEQQHGDPEQRDREPDAGREPGDEDDEVRGPERERGDQEDDPPPRDGVRERLDQRPARRRSGPRHGEPHAATLPAGSRRVTTVRPQGRCGCPNPAVGTVGPRRDARLARSWWA